MAQSGHGSRRNIEILIAQGHITINGQVAKLGDLVGPGDRVKLDGKLISLRFGTQLPRVLLYHKPEGEICTRDDPEGRPTVFAKLPKVNNARWVSIGRLDFNTSGLLIFTTNGELANHLMHPRYEIEREYAVRLMGELTTDQVLLLTGEGVDIDGENCKFVRLVDRGGEGCQPLVPRGPQGREEPRGAAHVRGGRHHGEPPHARALRPRGAARASSSAA